MLHKKKFKGVIIGAAAVVIAVKDTESSIFPFEREEIKLEMFPPGQEATKIIPRAIIGVIKGFNIKARRKVTNGRHTQIGRAHV